MADRDRNAAVMVENGRVRLHSEADEAWRRRGPTSRVLRAFQAREQSLQQLAGGAGYAWTDGRIVLKPVGCVPEHDWVSQIYAGWTAHDSVRVPEPVAPTMGKEGEWSLDGWGAHAYVSGRDVELLGELAHVKQASDLFHAELTHVTRPAFLDLRDDPWAFGDRIAWEETGPVGDEETLAVIDRLREHLGPVTSPDQPIHGDLLPNVLVADGLPPAVIDWPPYFRPAGMANAIAITDAVTFRGAPLSLLDEWETGADWDQLLIRALLYRLGPTGIFALRKRLRGGLMTHVQRVWPVVEAVLARTESMRSTRE